MDAVIEARGLVKRYGGIAALDGVSFSVPAGEPVGLVGPNGAGKTTFFAVLCGLVRPSAGSVTILGRPPLHPRLRGAVSLLPQDVPLARGVPVLRQLTLLAGLQGFRGGAARREARRVLAALGVEHLAAKAPETLSFGMRKRVAIGQAFIGEPELVLLDEPTSGLDPEGAELVHALVRRLAPQRSFMISSHNLEEVEDLCGSALLVDEGRVVEFRPMAELVDRGGTLTVVLEHEPDEAVTALLAGVAGVCGVERGGAGERRLTIGFRDAAPERVQLEVLRVLGESGVGVLELSRGRGLRERVARLLKE